MAYMTVRHKVADFDTWKKVFDEHAATRKPGGSRGGWLFRNAANPNECFILWSWESLEKAQAFASSPDLREVMERAGVIEMPTITYFEDVEFVPV